MHAASGRRVDVSLWLWIAGGILAFFALALTGILDLIFRPILRRVLGEDGYEDAAENAREFRQDAGADADAKAAQAEGFMRAVYDMITPGSRGPDR